MSEASPNEQPSQPSTSLSVTPPPAELDELIGRKRVVAEVVERLRNARLVTLTGCGGIGKTRVGVRAAEEAGEAFDDVAFAGLVDVADGDADQLGTRLLVACGVRDNSAESPESRLVCHLRDQKLLLVLDNCEHVLRAVVPIVRTLLESAPQLTVLATSRRRLGIKGEQLFEVPPLSCAPVDGCVPEAVELLVVRAAERQVTVAPDDPAARMLCELQGGLPLAIELTAARIRVWGLAGVLAQLAEPLEIAGGVEPTDQVYHPRLRAMMDWSYRLLNPLERSLWAVLSEFRVPFTARRALKVCAGLELPADDVVEAFEGLLDNSILTRVEEEVDSPDQGAAAEAKFMMHEPVRRYGRQLRPDGVSRDAIKRAHAEYFAQLARRAACERYGPNEVEWLRVTAVAMCSFESAAAYFVATGECERALELAVDVCRTRVHMYAGLLAAGRRLVANALAAQPADQPTELQVSALAMEAWVAFGQGQGVAACALLKRAEAMAQQLGGSTPSGLLFAMGVAMALSPDPEMWSESVTALDQAAGAAAAAGDKTDASTRALFTAIAAAFHGGVASIARASALVAEAEKVGAGWTRGVALWTLALAEYEHGDPDQAVRALRQALVISRDLDDTQAMTWCVWLAAVIAASRGRQVAAATLFGAVDGLQRITDVVVVGLGPYLRVELAARKAGLREVTDELRAAAAAGRKLGAKEALCFALESLDRRSVCPAESKLTDREQAVVALVAQGLTNMDIAGRLVISHRTVESHVSNAMAKIGVSNRNGLTAWFMNSQR